MRGRKSRASESIASEADQVHGEFKPHSAEYEQDDDGFREGEGALREGPNSGMRSNHPLAVKFLQQNCTRRHVQRAHARVCSLCLTEIPALDALKG